MPVTRETSAGADSLFRALASAQRREILRILGGCTPDPGKTCCGPEEVCACKLGERLGLAPSTVSHHMKQLVEAGLVSARKDGLWVYYTLRRDALRAAAEELARY
ncbi:MAG: helix-turn-helix transcriptional regulator [Coriobacteriia bacterium]|nr:helix-turn-helix transcriptional regulator [Coriobacteriia bacterium]